LPRRRYTLSLRSAAITDIRKTRYTPIFSPGICARCFERYFAESAILRADAFAQRQMLYAVAVVLFDRAFARVTFVDSATIVTSFVYAARG